MKKEYTNSTNQYQVVGNTSLVLLEGSLEECEAFLTGTKIKKRGEGEPETLCIVAPGETVSGCYGGCCGACDQRTGSIEDFME